MEEDVVKDINEDAFNELIQMNKKLVVVEFYTPTCPVCRSMEPILQEVANEMKEEAVFIKIDASRNQSMAAFYGIMGVPTFKFFCGKEIMKEFQGEINHTIMRNTIKDLIKYMSQCKAKQKVFEMDGYG